MQESCLHSYFSRLCVSIRVNSTINLFLYLSYFGSYLDLFVLYNSSASSPAYSLSCFAMFKKTIFLRFPFRISLNYIYITYYIHTYIHNMYIANINMHTQHSIMKLPTSSWCLGEKLLPLTKRYQMVKVFQRWLWSITTANTTHIKN